MQLWLAGVVRLQGLQCGLLVVMANTRHCLDEPLHNPTALQQYMDLFVGAWELAI
jgi:hypothetical protein